MRAPLTYISEWSDIAEWNNEAVCVMFDSVWLKFKHIEFIEILTPSPQTLCAYLERIAKFDMMFVETGIRLYGYRLR